MINALRSVRLYPIPPANYYKPNRVSSTVKFGQVKANSIVTSSHQQEEDHHQEDNMDKKDEDQVDNINQKPGKPTEDIMANSFGEAYSTRCGDDGFGGIYGDNEPLPEEAEKHESNPNPKSEHIHEGYDTKQGSEVKEKEKARHQTKG
ncbi:hypothetical protein ACFE04_001386 [Oxalis oulophora]